MKKTVNYFVFAIFLLLTPGYLTAQGKTQLTVNAGYMFGGKMRFYEGNLEIDNNVGYGLSISREIRPDTHIEFYWAQMQSNMEFKPNPLYEYLRGSAGLDLNYFQLGSLKEFDVNETVKPFGLFTLGATWFDVKDKNIEDVVKFSISFGGGAKIWMSEKIGLRLQGRLMMPMFLNGGGLYCGIGTGGSGCGVSVGSSSTFVQGDLTAGLIFAF